MNRTFKKLLGAVAVLAALAGVTRAAESTADKDESLPLIVIDGVPLPDALRNLARQIGGNFIFDPRVPGFSTGPGVPLVAPAVSARWTNFTAHAALMTVLKEHKLVLVTNPVTTVTRIAPASLGVKPVVASQVGTNAGSVIPLLVLDAEPLTGAISKLAAHAGVKVALDPQLTSYAASPQTQVSIRWEKITAREALAALLDNYDLILIEDPATDSARIVVKLRAGGTAPKQRP